MKKLLAYIFLFIFSFQILPVKELGKMLFKNQLTEEIKETGDAEGESGESLKLKKDSDPFHHSEWSGENTARIKHLSDFLDVVFHEAERLPSHHIAEIPTPPPNYSA